MSAGDNTDEPPESAWSGAFVDEPFTVARSRTTRAKRWLLVNVTDASSPTCWTMAWTPWRDRSVIASLNERAVAVEVDAGRDPLTTAALTIRPPALVLFRDGKERARVVGGS